MQFELLRVSLTAALSLAILAGCGGSRDPLAHSCVATDQKFIQAASLDVTAFNVLADEFRTGRVGADEPVDVSEPEEPAHRVHHRVHRRVISPHSPSRRMYSST